MSKPSQRESSGGNASLVDILQTSALRVELVTIIALTTDSMRRDLISIFEPWKPPQHTADEHATGGSLIDFGVEQEAKNAKHRERSDLDSPQTKGLRSAALTYFDTWQIDVLRRLGEVLNVRSDAIRKARADAKAKALVVGKARKDKAYMDWANGIDKQPSVRGASSEDELDLLPDGFTLKVQTMPKDSRTLLLHSVLLLLLSLEQYNAHSRVLMLKLAQILRLPESTLVDIESRVAEALLSSAAAKMSADASTQRQASEGASARRWKIGAATVAGAALIGITGGLAAPILAAGVGGLMGGLGLGAVASLLGPLATNMVLVGGLFGAYGGRMTGGIMKKYAQAINDFEFLPTSTEQLSVDSADEAGVSQLQDEGLRRSHKLRVAIGVSGSVTDAEGFLEPWKVFASSRIESFGLRWEMDALMQLGRKISEVLKSYAWDFAKFQLLSMILSGLWPFGLLRAAASLDSPFAIAKTRSDKAGKVLADALVNRVQGARPVTLVGFGLGARVIYSCLIQLAQMNAFGLVESAVFMGSPTPSDAASWRRARAVVSGRVTNVFSSDDFMLGFLYRASSAQLGVAGCQEVEGVRGVENFDFTDLVKSHNDYSRMAGTILQRIGFADLDGEVVRKQQEDLKQAKKQEMIQDRVASGLEDMALPSEYNILARQDELGNVVKLEYGKAEEMAYDIRGELHASRSELEVSTALVITPTVQADEDDTDDEEPHAIQMTDNTNPLVTIEPVPEPDFGPDRETVRFGTDGERGFDVRWEYTERR